MESNLDIMISEYKKLYEQKKLLYLLKTGKELKRREFHKIIVYLAKLTDYYWYSDSRNCVKDNYNTVSSIYFNRLASEDLESICKTFNRFVPESSQASIVSPVHGLKDNSSMYRVYYNKKSIDWGSIDAELMTNHSFNIKMHEHNKIPYIKNFHLKWWEQQHLNLANELL